MINSQDKLPILVRDVIPALPKQAVSALTEQGGDSLHSLTGVSPCGRTDDDAMSQSLKCAGSNPAGGTSCIIFIVYLFSPKRRTYSILIICFVLHILSNCEISREDLTLDCEIRSNKIEYQPKIQ